jgi:hypothetical protein
LKIDDVVKSQKIKRPVIPVKTGIQCFMKFYTIWIPAPRFHGGKFIPAEAGTGMTTFQEHLIRGITGG